MEAEVEPMAFWREVQTPALQAEEAALLPALQRHPGNGAALRSVLRSAEKIGKMKTAPAASQRLNRDRARERMPAPKNGPGVRGALRHVLQGNKS